MSDKNIPFELQTEIIKRLPVKSLLRFCTVSKSYNCLINSSDFIAHYSSQHQHLLVSCCYFNHIWIVDDDDDSFPKQRVSVTLPDLVKKLKNPYTIGISHGLLCFCGNEDSLNMAVIWNPSIRKAVTVNMPEYYDETYTTSLGFGVCRETTDPKIVKIAIDVDGVKPWQVEVFALSTRAWRRPHGTTIPSGYVYIYSDPVVVDGCLYWVAIDDSVDNLIVSFDLTTEEFGQTSLSGSLVQSTFHFSLYNLKESLVVIEPDLEANELAYRVWMMEDGVTKSFNKLFTVSTHLPYVRVLGVKGFRKTGEALVEARIHPVHPRSTDSVLATYEPFTKSVSIIGTNGKHDIYFVNSYMETLLLL